MLAYTIRRLLVAIPTMLILVAACFFPHTNIELFPSVMAELAAHKRA